MEDRAHHVEPLQKTNRRWLPCHRHFQKDNPWPFANSCAKASDGMQFWDLGEKYLSRAVAHLEVSPGCFALQPNLAKHFLA